MVHLLLTAMPQQFQQLRIPAAAFQGEDLILKGEEKGGK
jgi:hypothetical protein